MTGRGIGTQPSGGTEPIEPRHHDIERDNIGPNVLDDLQTLGTISRGHDLEALQLKVDPDQLPDHPIVIDNEHTAGRA